MRKIGEVPDPAAAERFVDVMTAREVAVRIDRPSDDSPAEVWVVDEDRREEASATLARFLENPDSAEFDGADAAAADVRRRQDAAVTARAKLVRQTAWRRPIWQRVPVTVAMIGACVAIAAVTMFGKSSPAVMQALYIAPYEVDGGMIRWAGLSAITGGEVWRLVTPAFLHLGPLHLLFNMMWLWSLGGPIEIRRGRVRLILLVVGIAAVSNVSEYYVDLDLRTVTRGGSLIGFDESPLFGGMSGVVYGLVGYIWTRSKLSPTAGLYLPRQTMAWMLIWFVICLTGLVGPVANVAHGVGLLAGFGFGQISVWLEGTPLGKR
ncbi:MAG: rhomboid family intramembrane serine protease [Planctomycetota bacterium]